MRLYTTPECPQCKRVKALLNDLGKPFDELDLREAKNITDLRISGIFSMQAPILVLGIRPLVYLDAGQIAASSDEALRAAVT